MTFYDTIKPNKGKVLDNHRFRYLAEIWLRYFGEALMTPSQIIKLARYGEDLAKDLSHVIPENTPGPGQKLSHFLRRFKDEQVMVDGVDYRLTRVGGYWCFKDISPEEGVPSPYPVRPKGPRKNGMLPKPPVLDPQLALFRAWLCNFEIKKKVRAVGVLNAAARDPDLDAAVNMVLPEGCRDPAKSLGKYLSRCTLRPVRIGVTHYVLKMIDGGTNPNRYAMFICPQDASFDVFGHMYVSNISSRNVEEPKPLLDETVSTPVSLILTSWLSHIGPDRLARTADFIAAINQDPAALDEARELFGVVTPQSVRSYLTEISTAAFEGAPYTVVAAEGDRWVIRASEDTE